MADKRVPQNEFLFRRLNEQIHTLDLNSGEGRLDAVCECSDERCFAHVPIALTAYSELRRHPRRFVVVPGHESPDGDVIIGRGTGFVVVEKPETVAPAELPTPPGSTMGELA